MALEAQEVTIRTRLLGAAQFKRDAASVSDSIRGVGAAAEQASVEGRGVGGFNAALDGGGKALEATGARLRKAGRSMREFGVSAMTASVPILFIGDASVKAAMGFQTGMSLLQRQANDSGRDIAYLTGRVKEMAVQLGTTPTDLATNGLYNIVSAGHHGADAMNALKAATMGAKLGIDDLQNTSTALMAVMNSGLGGKGRNRYLNTMGVLDAIVGQGMMHLPDLTEALHSEIMPMVKETGGSLMDIGAIMSALTREGIPATKFANLSKLTLTKLLSPQGAALKALEGIGLSQYQLADDVHSGPHGLIKALTDLQRHLTHLPRDMRTTVLAQAFGQSRGISNIMAILSMMPRINQILGVLERRGNARSFEQHYRQYQHTDQYQFDRLKAQIQLSEIELGHAILPVLIPLLKSLTKIISTLVHDFMGLPKPMRDTLVKVMALGIAIGPVVFAFGSIVTVLGGLASALAFTVGLFGAEGALARVLPGLAAMFGGMATEGAVMTGAFVELIPQIAILGAAIAGVIALWHSKLGNDISKAGYNTGQWIRHNILQNVFGMGKSFDEKRGDYYHSAAYKHLSSRQRDAIAMLLGFTSNGHVREYKTALGGVNVGSRTGLPLSYYEDLLAGVNLPSWLHVPHLTDAHHRVLSDLSAISSGGKIDLTVHVNNYMDGKLVTRTVNKVNRQTHNRR